MATTHTSIPALTETTFDELIGSATVPVVVDFTASWCPPCGPTADALAVVAGEHPGRLLAGSVDVDVELDLARRYGVQSMPTLLVFVDGEPVDRLVGGRGPGRLREDLSRHLG
jgi:thioredoxin 1